MLKLFCLVLTLTNISIFAQINYSPYPYCDIRVPILDNEQQEIYYSDSTKQNIIIKELLVCDKNGECAPFKTSLKKFRAIPLYDKSGILIRDGTARGIRIYNFGCVKIRKSGEYWEGQICVDSNGHAVFRNPIFGIQALIQVLVNYNKAGINTPTRILHKYAPEKDCVGSVKKWDEYLQDSVCAYGSNNPNDYASNVAKELNIDINNEIKIVDEHNNLSFEMLKSLINAIVHVECGSRYKVDEEIIKQAILKIKK